MYSSVFPHHSPLSLCYHRSLMCVLASALAAVAAVLLLRCGIFFLLPHSQDPRVDANRPAYSGSTALVLAALGGSAGHAKAVALLLRHRHCNPNLRTLAGHSPLYARGRRQPSALHL